VGKASLHLVFWLLVHQAASWMLQVMLVVSGYWLGLAGYGAVITLAALAALILGRSLGRHAPYSQGKLIPGVVFMGMWMLSFLGVLPYRAMMTPLLPGLDHVGMDVALALDASIWIVLSLAATAGILVGSSARSIGSPSTDLRVAGFRRTILHGSAKKVSLAESFSVTESDDD